MGETTQSRSRTQLQAYAREHNVHVVFGSNDDNFTITGKCPSHKLTELFALIRDILFHSRFHDSDLTRFKNEMIAGTLQAMQSPETQLSELVKSVVLKNHPYGTLQKTYLASLKNISTADLSAYMKTHFTQENLIISACGDIDEAALAAQVSDVITTLPKTFKVSLSATAHVTGPYQKHTQTFPVPQTVIRLLHEGIDAHHPDFFALQIAMNCLSEHSIGLLSKNVRVEKGLAYGIGAGLAMSDHYNTFNIVTSTHTESVEQALAAIKGTLADIYKNGFPADLVEVIKKSFLGNYKRSFSSTGNIAARLTNYQLDDRPVDFHNIIIEKISSLTVDDINKAFKKFLKPDQFVIFTVGQ